MSLARSHLIAVLASLSAAIIETENTELFFQNARYAGEFNPAQSTELPNDLVTNDVLWVTHNGFFKNKPLLTGQLLKYLGNNAALLLFKPIIPIPFLSEIIGHNTSNEGTSENIAELISTAINEALSEEGQVGQILGQLVNNFNTQLSGINQLLPKVARYFAQQLNNPADLSAVNIQQMDGDDLLDTSQVTINIDDSNPRQAISIIFGSITTERKNYSLGQLCLVTVNTNTNINEVYFACAGTGQFVTTDTSVSANTSVTFVITYLGHSDDFSPQFALLNKMINN
ncbi:hypothetical protein [Agitococcus lubricus]|uniref:Uncharacterized protein n=1 Tax=Agitococcus lubricus TaxID=1077255 RepID=A0A2T5J1K5_9GAMM|nr:hypothetical protein [Agitococcus lubricus]PTQ90278.1 hypothetical protein C8N29_10331 [Agitococcus lubricus]